MTHKEQTTQSTGKPKHVFRKVLRLLVRNFFDHNVASNAAALAYFLLFAMFPLLIFVSNLLGLLDLDVASITRNLQQVFPRGVVEIVGDYLEYVSRISSPTLLWFSLIFTVYFPTRAAGGLMDDVRLAYQLEKPRNPVTYLFRKLVYTLVLLVAIVLTLLLSIVGRRVLEAVMAYFPALDELAMLDMLVMMWQYFRFFIVAALMFVALGLLYAFAQDRRETVRTIMPGVAAALAAWMAVSIGFSFYVENFSNYSVIYGTLGTVVILLSWLYITSMILILGAELNAALWTVRHPSGREEQR